MNHFQNLYRHRLSRCLYWSLSLGCLPWPAQAADLVYIQPHPIDAIVQQNMIQNSAALPFKKTGTIDRMRIMHIDIDYVYDENKAQQQENIQALLCTRQIS